METKSPNIYSWFMKREAFILTLAIIFIFVFGIALTVGYSHYKGQIRNTIQRNKLTANLLAALILEHQKAAIGIIQSYARHPLFINSAKKKDFNEIIKHLNHLKENNPEIDNAFITDQDAILWADFPIDKESYGKNFSHRDWFKGVSKEWKPYISSVYPMIVGEKDLAVAVCAPIFDEKGKAIGILGTAQRTDFLGRIIHQVKLDAENKITLIDQMGQIIYSDRFAYEKRVIGYPFVDLINKAITEKKDDLEIQDPHESSNVRYTAFVPIKGFGWSVIVEREKRSVLRSEFEYFFQLAFLFTLLFLFIAISLAFFRKQFIHRQTVVLLNTEKEMREKERRYSSLLENINMIAVGMDTDGNITFANPFLLKLTGYALEEVIGRSWFDTFLLEREREVLKGVFQEILLKGFHPHPDNPILTKSGDERLIAWNNTILKDIHGQVLGMMSIGEDITERKQAEETLQRSREYFRSITENASDVVIILDKKGTITYASPSIERFSGYKPEELIGKSGFDFIMPADLPRAIIDLSKAILTKESAIPNVFRVRHKDGSERVFDGLGKNLLDNPTVAGFVMNIRDITERKRAEEELIERERFNFALFEYNPIQTVVVDSEGKVTKFNLAKKKSGDRLPNIGDVMYKDYAGMHEIDMYAELMKCIRSGEEKEFPEQKYGNKVLSITISPFSKGAVITSQDTTERKRAEEALRQAEENFRRSLDESPLGVRIVTTEGETVYGNRAILEIYGYDSIEELRTTPIKKRYTPESYAEFQIRKKKRQQGEYDPPEYEISIMKKNGEVRHLQVFRKEVLWNGEKQFQTVYQDITERKQAEEAMRESEERYRTILDNIEDGYFEVDMAGNFTFFNDSLCRELGYSQEEMMGMNNRQYMDKETAKKVYQAFNQVYATGEPYKAYDWEIIRKDGTKRIHESSVSLMRDAQGERIGFRGVTRDITERKRAEEERGRLLADLEAKNKELEAFVYTISHDLKAPLVSLSGFSFALQKDSYSQLGKEGKHYLERIQSNVAHMEALLTSLLELSRIGRVVGSIEEIDVGLLLRKVRDELAVRIEEVGAEFLVQEPLPTVRADRGRIHPVFANLIENAVKFRSAERALRIEVGCRQEGGFYRFHVADNGIGIAPQYHEQIFAPFRKLHPEIEGVGIGLALVKKIVEHHGGRVWVQSEAGKGATFYFTIYCLLPTLKKEEESWSENP